MMRIQGIVLTLSILVLVVKCSIYQKYYDVAYSIAAVMTLDQKIGQTTQLDFNAITDKNGTQPSLATKYSLGSLLVSGDGVPDQHGNMINLPVFDQPKTIEYFANATIEKWQKLTDKFNNLTMSITTNEGKTYEIKLLLATDAVHNDQHVSGNILFPHNIGLSCSHNPDNFYNLGKWTTFNVKRSGFNYVFAPTVAVSHNPQWGRYYQTMGQQVNLIYQYAQSFIQGLQGNPQALTGILGSAKHFFGDGATMYGADEGNAQVGSFKSFVNNNIQGYYGSIAAEVGSVMCSYSAINWLPLSLSPFLGNLLRGKLNFDGFVISDYDQVTRLKDQQVPTCFQTFGQINQAVCQIINAGIDMIMIPSFKKFQQYADGIKFGIRQNVITVDRLNDAVARILSVKLALGIAKPKGNVRQQHVQSQTVEINPLANTQYQDSLQAVRQSLVLIKNNGSTIPFKTDTLEYIVLIGQKIVNINNLAKYSLFTNYDDIGMQCGGWSVRWQGFDGNTQWKDNNKKLSNASSIVDALQGLKKKIQLIKPNYTTFSFQQTAVIDMQREQYLNKLKTLRKNMTAANTIILAVLGQPPYAQFSGDAGIPYCQNESAISGQGCLYDNGNNPYMPNKQKSSIGVQFNKFEQNVIQNIRAQDENIPLVTVLLAGRPMLLDKIMDQSNAILHAFLPGTSGGQGIIEALTGQYIIRPKGQSDVKNSLSFDWPRTSAQLQRFPVYGGDGKIPRIQNPLFNVGYGLSTKIN